MIRVFGRLVLVVSGNALSLEINLLCFNFEIGTITTTDDDYEHYIYIL